MDARQQKALDFLSENVEFFSAPFWNPFIFKKWAIENEKQIRPLSDALFQALSHDIEKYSEALIGKGNRDRHNSLLRRNSERMIELLQSNPELVDVLCRFASEKNEILHTWNKWYQLNPDIIPKPADEKYQQKLSEKIAYFELISPIEEKTNRYLKALSCDLLKAIRQSSLVKELFESKYLLESEKINYFLGEQTKSLYSHHAKAGTLHNSLVAFAQDVALGTIDPQLPLNNNINSLAFKFHHANNLKIIIQQPDLPPEKKLQQARASLDKPHIREKLGAERGFWCWVLEKLGLHHSRGKKLISFFDEKYHAVRNKLSPTKLQYGHGLEISEEKEFKVSRFNF